ncbi:XRE family transcriptional regulator [Noviherbaspirillum sp.]|uniref:ImmA/IrrE family metallo-endopeptidase n=1 Tax=Noviherbaspirillum sp. TaxID=1926288 RepID=UPI002B45F009|nr:XRE family transcriptional regulator [Noviherbaspirillum sp.]HJV82415.1 XRE family transcriptional regulator [Noviherbaspirillum sp.]
MPSVNPDVLRWARETAGLSLDDAAKGLQLGGARLSPADALGRIEGGEAAPSRSLLLRMTKTYRRPLLTFYLAKPPERGERGEDFRTLPEDRVEESAGKLDALVRDVFVRQRLVKEALEDAEEAVALPFVGSIQMDQPVEGVCRSLRKALDFELDQFRKKRTIEDAFRYLRNQVELTGVFVLLIGNLGSHHSNVSAEVFRGFALADKVSPFIVVNDQDAKSAWSFTLLHELVHIWLGQTGISGGAFEKHIEKFCNDVASELLVPQAELAEWNPRVQRIEDLVADISEFGDTRKVSRSMVAYRLYKAGRITKVTWETLTGRFRELWLQEKTSIKQAAAEAEGGPSYYMVRRHRLGSALVKIVKRTLDEGVLTPTKAGRILGVRPNNVALLVDGV